MSNRTLVELNHDFCPNNDTLLGWATFMQRYMRGGDKDDLPKGVTFIQMHHHSEPSIVESLQEQLDAANQRIAELEDNAKLARTAERCARIAYERALIEQGRGAKAWRGASQAARDICVLNGVDPDIIDTFDDDKQASIRALFSKEQQGAISRTLDEKARAEAAERKLTTARTALEVIDQMAYRDVSENRETEYVLDYDSVKAVTTQALVQIEQPQDASNDLANVEVIETPPDHALAELYKDPEFLAEYQQGLKEERQKLGLPQPPSSPTTAIDPIPGETK